MVALDVIAMGAKRLRNPLFMQNSDYFLLKCGFFAAFVPHFALNDVESYFKRKARHAVGVFSPSKCLIRTRFLSANG